MFLNLNLHTVVGIFWAVVATAYILTAVNATYVAAIAKFVAVM